jgi:DNA mismatch repair protein MutL
LIRLLDGDTINKIAAGEVIENPSSVVKELVENSIDAKALRVLIEVSGGGKSLIRVTDDGCGISPNEAPLAFERHATSKISKADDLQSIETLGFRGEALASIAAVFGRIEMRTKVRGAAAGTLVVIEKGRLVERRDIGCPAGTSIFAERIFENVPARKKHLSGDQEELARVASVVTELAIINHSISFELFSGSRTIFQSPASSSWDQALISTFGSKVVRKLLPVRFAGKGFEITGAVGSSEVFRSGTEWIFVYVNGRAVSSRMVLSSLREAYYSVLPSGKSPIAVISLEIDPSMVDVNVHPTKREVRFLNEDEIGSSLIRIVQEALRSSDMPSPEAVFGGDPAESLRRGLLRPHQRTLSDEPELGEAEREEVATANGLKPATTDDSACSLPGDESGTSTDIEHGDGKNAGARDLRILGQTLETYIVAEDDVGLILIDQHAAAERVRYEQLIRRYETRSISQELSVPVTIELSAKEQILLQSWSEVLSDMGFEIAPFGGNSFSVRSVPATESRLDSPQAVYDLLTDLFAIRRPLRNSTTRDEVLKLFACRRSIKSGKEMDRSEMRRLLIDLSACENPKTCPHGRPTMIRISKLRLERLFGRA